MITKDDSEMFCPFIKGTCVEKKCMFWDNKIQSCGLKDGFSNLYKISEISDTVEKSYIELKCIFETLLEGDE